METEFRTSSPDSSSGSEQENEKYVRRTSSLVITRPSAGDGYWLCLLLPVAFTTQYLRESKCTPSSSYADLAIAAVGMCLESLGFFTYIAYMHIFNTWLLFKLLLTFVPVIITALLYRHVLGQSQLSSICWSLAVVFCYQTAYIRVLRGFQRCFSFGEAAVLVQGLVLFILSAILQLPNWIFVETVKGEFNEINAIMMSALACLLISCWLLVKFPELRQTFGFYALMVILVAAVTCVPVTKPMPIVKLFDFILADKSRVVILLTYFALVGFTVGTICWQLHNGRQASTSERKAFHYLIVLVYVPGLLSQCALLYIASGVALAIFTVLELFRILEIPPLGATLQDAFHTFSDEKDAGMLAVTPFSLLIGCSLPIWISPCACSHLNTCSNEELLPLMAGILSIGVGDTAASIVGSKFGRNKWRNSTRSKEGTIAYVLAVVLAVYCLTFTGLLSMTLSNWLFTMAATLTTALIEAHTDQIDNLVLPMVFYIIVSLG